MTDAEKIERLREKLAETVEKLRAAETARSALAVREKALQSALDGIAVLAARQMATAAGIARQVAAADADADNAAALAAGEETP